jgi:cathepsin A (carboxypeptidase C)
MNNPSVKAALGVNPALTFQSCNMEGKTLDIISAGFADVSLVNQAFSVNGDGMRNSAKLLTDIVNEGKIDSGRKYIGLTAPVPVRH